MQTTAVALVGALAIVLGAPAWAPAQVRDHLRCIRIVDPVRFPANVDLLAEQVAFTAPGCRIVKAKSLCLPVQKTNVAPPPPRPDVTGQALQDAYICYQARCPRRFPEDQVVTDQFGERTTNVRFSSTQVCVPAVTGTVPTTTTTAAPTTTTGTTTTDTTTTTATSTSSTTTTTTTATTTTT